MSNTENKQVKSIAEINIELAGLPAADLQVKDIAELYADDGALIGINQLKVQGVIYDALISANNVYQLSNTHATTTSQDSDANAAVEKSLNSTISVADAINAAANGTGVISGEKFVQEPVVLTQRAPVVNAAKAAPVTAAAPVVKAAAPVAGVVVKSTAAVADTQLPEVTAALAVAKMQTVPALTAILNYARDMHPAQPQTKDSIEKSQLRLLNALSIILVQEDENFPVVFKAVIAIVKANRNLAFKVTMVHRGMNTVSLATIDNDTMRFLTRLIDVLYVASGMNDVSQVKTAVDMKKLLSSVANVKANKNLTNFFS